MFAGPSRYAGEAVADQRIDEPQRIFRQQEFFPFELRVAAAGADQDQVMDRVPVPVGYVGVVDSVNTIENLFELMLYYRHGT